MVSRSGRFQLSARERYALRTWPELRTEIDSQDRSTMIHRRLFQPSLRQSSSVRGQELDLRLLSNQNDQAAEQPPNFRLPLYAYQLRSLGWMLSREQNSGGVFHGGILADAIGFGKTTITLALMDHNRCPSTPPRAVTCRESSNELFPSRATLIIVPPNLWQQWSDEISKFLPTASFRVIAATNGADLRKYSKEDFCEVDVVIVSYRIFHGRSYANLRHRLKHFCWYRIIADEFHELIAGATDAKHPFNEAKHQLCDLESRYRWGLTSTPPLKTMRDVAVTATFFQRKIERTPESCAEFVHDMVRRNTEGLQRPGIVQHKVTILQTIHERALYLQHERDGNHQGGDLLQSASLHHSQSTSSSRPRTAEQVCADVLKERQSQVKRMEAKLNDHALTIEAYARTAGNLLNKRTTVVVKSFWYFTKWYLERIDASLCAHEALATSVTDGSEGSKSAQAALAASIKDGKERDEIPELYLRNIDASDHCSIVRALQQEVVDERESLQVLGKCITELLLFERSIEEVEQSYACPICMETVQSSQCGIAPCAHVACTACWAKCLNRDARCPLCRRSLRLSQVHPMAQEAHKSRCIVDKTSAVRSLGLHINRSASTENVSFGTKVQGIIETLESIWQTEPGAKVLVFCQWEVLRITIQSALKHKNVAHVTLQGHEVERASIIRRFADNVGSNVMLLSMEVSPSGLNLTMANHVILVQPTWHGENHEKSVDYEEQAVGRCWRTGQERTVHIWRLCTAGTVEEDMVQQHAQIWADRQARAGINVLTVDHS